MMLPLLSTFVLAGAINTLPPTPSPPSFIRIEAHAPKAVLLLEVADTEPKREYGLMFRTALSPHNGMVFVFPGDGRQEFWMKNTLIPLDMVFVGADERVRSVAADVPQSSLQTPDSKVAVRVGRGKFVIELPAGEARADGIHPGSYVRGIGTLKPLGF